MNLIDIFLLTICFSILIGVLVFCGYMICQAYILLGDIKQILVEMLEEVEE